MLSLDHLLWAVPDLEEGIAQIEGLTGIRPVMGGRHPGRGTWNALVSLGGGCYLELISADREQVLSGNLGAIIEARAAAGLLTFAVRADDLDEVARDAAKAGIPFRGPEDWSRKQPDGPDLTWRLGFADQTRFGFHLPLFIDWQQSPHPSLTAPAGLTLDLFEVMHPGAEDLARYYGALGIDLPVRRSDRPAFRAVLEGPRGELVLTS